MGSGCAASPKYVIIFAITVDASTTSMNVNLSPHEQCSISMAKTRFNNYPQLIRTGKRYAHARSTACPVTDGALGTAFGLSFAFRASTP